MISTILWMISKLSEEYIHTVKVTTEYTNLTNDKIMRNKPLTELDVLFEISGFNLLKHNFFKNKLIIDLSKINKSGSKYFYVTNSNLSSLQSQFSYDKKILKITPDTLFFDFGKLTSKEITVNPKIKINYEAGHSLMGELDIKPEKITINGTDEQILNIKSINTKPLELDNVSKDFTIKLSLDIPKEYSKIHFSNKEILINGIVEKYTEATIKVPFKLINVPSNINISTIIDKVNLTYKVSLNNFDKISDNDFKIVCDYKHNNSTFLVPRIIEKPNLVSNVKISPKKIKFLIKK